MRMRSRSLRWCIALAIAAGACTKNSSSPSAPTCSFSVAQPATTTFGAGGGTGSMTVTAGSNCAWTAVSNAAFITITQGSTGSANGTVQFSVAANTGPDRTGTLTVAGSTITLSQGAGTASAPVTLGAPAPRSPIGGTEVTIRRPTLIVDNAVATGDGGPVTYRFELCDQSSFPIERTTVADGVAQGSGTTSWTLDRDLGPNASTWFWRARATNGTATSAFSNVESFRTPAFCSFTVSPAAITATGGGGTATVTVSGSGSCAWTATSNASFISVTSGASGSGSGTVTLAIAPNTGSSRTGTVTVAGQTVTVTQPGTGIAASFRLLDPATQGGATTECRIRSATSQPITCIVESTSFTLGPNVITSYAWTVKYTYPTEKTLTQSAANPRFSFTDLCGQTMSTDDGATTPLAVTLSVTDNLGETVTVTSGSSNQPALSLRLFTCGK
jgi:Putative binding domain, N-terminal